MCCIHGLVRDERRPQVQQIAQQWHRPTRHDRKIWRRRAAHGRSLSAPPSGNDIKFDEQRVKGYKHFANKLWNIARFVFSQENTGEIKTRTQGRVRRACRRYNQATSKNIRIYMAAEKLYHYVWDRFAAQIIEESKGKPEYGANALLHPENHAQTPASVHAVCDRRNLGLAARQQILLMVEEWPVK